MLIDRALVRALAGAIMIVAVPMGVGAESPSDASTPPGRADTSNPSPSTGRTLTGKERLGGKASDEQRVDNCKVPLDQRGPKPRPDSCDHHRANMR